MLNPNVSRTHLTSSLFTFERDLRLISHALAPRKSHYPLRISFTKTAALPSSGNLRTAAAAAAAATVSADCFSRDSDRIPRDRVKCKDGP